MVGWLALPRGKAVSAVMFLTARLRNLIVRTFLEPLRAVLSLFHTKEVERQQTFLFSLSNQNESVSGRNLC